jgi:hypothetical protein
MGMKKNTYIILIGKPLGNCVLESMGRRKEDKIGMNIREVCCKDGRRWMELAEKHVQ